MLSVEQFEAATKRLEKIMTNTRDEHNDALADARSEIENLTHQIQNMRQDLTALIQRIDGNDDYSGEIANLN